jgi:hypothetical protein
VVVGFSMKESNVRACQSVCEGGVTDCCWNLEPFAKFCNYKDDDWYKL